MSPEAVLVVGAGGHAKVAIAALHEQGTEVFGVLDDNTARHGQKLLEVPIIGPVDLLHAHPERPALLAIGDNAVRRKLALRFATRPWLRLIHPRAWVHDSVRLGVGTVVFAGAIIQPDCVLGEHCIVNTSASIDHDCIVGDFVHVAPGVHMSGGVRLDDGVFMGVGSCAIPLSHVGEWSIVGGGGAVIGELAAHVTAVGVPAKVIKRHQEGA